MTSRRTCVIAAACAAFAMTAPSSHAQEAWPTKAIRIIVPYAPGTPPDIVTRIVAAKLTDLGSVIVDNKPGGAGAVAMSDLMRQPADGYTLLTMLQPVTVSPSLNSAFKFDLMKDVVPIGQMTRYSNVLVVYPQVEATSVAQLVSTMKAQSTLLSFASGGPGTPAHLAGELFKQQAKVKATHVPYNQFTLGLADLVAGRVQFMFATSSAIVPFIQQGKVRPLAVTGPARIPSLPDVPTMAESGYPGFNVTGWDGLVARTGTPKAIVERLNAELVKAVRSKEVEERFGTLGVDAVSSTPEQFGSLIASEVDRWGTLVRTAGITGQ